MPTQENQKPSAEEQKKVLHGKTSKVGDPVPEPVTEAPPEDQKHDPKAGLETGKDKKPTSGR